HRMVTQMVSLSYTWGYQYGHLHHGYPWSPVRALLVMEREDCVSLVTASTAFHIFICSAHI
ncbi:hypothetical protein BgiMline_020155, partial [Biomphalaria glabrata]